jgi:uncharacterized membrane protein YkvA (DUF1232 family)
VVITKTTMKQIVLVKSLTEWSLSAMINESEGHKMRRDLTPENVLARQPEFNSGVFGASAGWPFSGDMAQIDRFIIIGSSQIRSADLKAIIEKSRQVHEKIYRIQEQGLSDLKRQARLIMQTIEFAARLQFEDPLPTYLAEGAFGMLYLIREEDLIPDLIPGIGLTDDAILVNRVFRRNEADFIRLEMLFGSRLRPQI